MGLVDKIKNDVKKSGTNKGKIMYFRPDQKMRVRFLSDMDEGFEIVFHDSYNRGITVPCQETFGEPCPFCEDEELRTRSQYIWSVYDYESKEVKLLMFPVSNCSPVPALVAMNDQFGTLVDRDYIITRLGKNTNTSYSVIPMDKNKFRNPKAKALSKSAVYKIIKEAYPVDDDDEEEDEKPRSKKKRPAAKVTARKKEEEFEDDYDDEEEDSWEDEEEDEAPSYDDMTPIELYKECKKRGLEVMPKKPAKYYIRQLEEDDKAHDDWEDDEDEWEDDDE